MALGKGEQIENEMHRTGRHGECNHSARLQKQMKHRVERRRAKQNPECDPEYRRYSGWMY